MGLLMRINGKYNSYAPSGGLCFLQDLTITSGSEYEKNNNILQLHVEQRQLLEIVPA